MLKKYKFTYIKLKTHYLYKISITFLLIVIYHSFSFAEESTLQTLPKKISLNDIITALTKNNTAIQIILNNEKKAAYDEINTKSLLNINLQTSISKQISSTPLTLSDQTIYKTKNLDYNQILPAISLTKNFIFGLEALFSSQFSLNNNENNILSPENRSNITLILKQPLTHYNPISYSPNPDMQFKLAQKLYLEISKVGFSNDIANFLVEIC